MACTKGEMIGMEHEREWAEAQKITVSIDLVDAAKTHLNFLAAVDRNRFLFEDHVLQRAIFRYNAFWLPLLAKHLENPVIDGPLVAPLDCEWIWHCHRLNPVRYRFDCEELFGRIIVNDKSVSSVEAKSSSTKEIWSKMYPDEPYELDLNIPFSLQKSSLNKKFTSYDLISAVKRQIPFVFQVSRPHMSDDIFLQEAATRYKGFLHMIKTNKMMNQDRVCVPTYDVDLMWHTHLLNPDAYYKDMNELVGFVVQHDDSDSDRTKGGKLDKAHSATTNQWEQTYGSSYWKAGAMYRGNVPTPVTQVPYESHYASNDFKGFEKFGLHFQFNTLKLTEVLLEFADIKNLPEEYKENLFVAFSKKQPDKLFASKTSLGVSSNTKEKQVAIFECEPKGVFLFELTSYSTTSNQVNPTPMLLGSCSLSLEELLNSQSQLSINKWLSVDPVSDLKISEPMLLHVFMSFTPPNIAPQVFQLLASQPLGNDKIKSFVIDTYGNNKVFSLEKRNKMNQATKSGHDLLKEVYLINDIGEKQALVEYKGDYWSLKGTDGSFMLQESYGNDGSLFELLGYKMVKVFQGKRLEFEPKHFKTPSSGEDFMTAVEFSSAYPYGKAVALIDSKSKTIKTMEEWMVVPGIALAFMLTDFTSESGFPAGGDMAKKGVDGTEFLPKVVEEVNGADCFSACEPCGLKHSPFGARVHLVNSAYGTQFMD